ncbi:MAG: hypothetical protein IT350_21080 [Deltaproteobacteria bacterium]|nr:hypothetical protein [Deltaproteobacteria bacterium]
MVNSEIPSNVDVPSSRVLLIESGANASRSIQKLLTQFGFSVRACSDSKAAIGHALSFKPQVVVAADGMPAISGTELARLFKSLPDLAVIPFILVTDEPASHAGRSDVGARRADDLVFRPALESVLIFTVSRWTQAPRPRFTPRIDPYPRSLGQVRGLIHTISLVEALYCLISSQVSGYLFCRLERRQIHIGIDNGRVVDVRTNYDREDTFGRFLVKILRITPADLRRAQAAYPVPDTLKHQIYVDLGILTPDDLGDALRQFHATKLLSVFKKTWDGGFFEFRPCTISSDVPEKSNLKLCDFLKFGLKRHVAVRWALRDMEREARERMLKLRQTRRFDRVSKLLELDGASTDMLRRLEGRTLRELRHEPTYDHTDAVHLVFLMLVTGAMRLGPRDDAQDGAALADIPGDDAVLLPLEAETEADLRYLTELQHGQKCFHDNKFERASHHLRAAMDLNRHSSEAMALMAWIVFCGGRPGLPAVQEAKDLLKESLSLNDRNDRAHYFLGLIFKSEHKYSLAATHFRMAYALNPLNEDAEIQIRQSLDRLQKDGGEDAGSDSSA